MSRIIYCMFLKKNSEGQEYPIYPGKIGVYIYKNISKKAWEIWKKKQTQLINEKKLSMINSNDRNLLEQEMISFLFKGIINKDNISKYF